MTYILNISKTNNTNRCVVMGFDSNSTEVWRGLHPIITHAFEDETFVGMMDGVVSIIEKAEIDKTEEMQPITQPTKK